MSFDNAFKLKPDSDKSLNNKSVALLSLGRADEALKELERVNCVKILTIGYKNQPRQYRHHQ